MLLRDTSEIRQLSTQQPFMSVFVETSAKALDGWMIMISPFLQRPWRWSLCLSPLREPCRRCFPPPSLMPWGPKRTERPSRSCSCSRRSRTPRGRRDRRRSSGTTPASLSSTGLTSRTRSRSWWSEVPLMWSTPSEWVNEWVCECVCKWEWWICLEVWGIVNKHCCSPCLQLLIVKDFKAQLLKDTTSLPLFPPVCANVILFWVFLSLMVFPKKEKSLKLIIPVTTSLFMTSSPLSHLLVDT